MKKTSLFIATLLVVSSLQASTTYKNLYVEVNAYPKGSGSVYLTAKAGDANFIAAASDDFSESSYIKFTPAENGNDYAGCEGFCADATGKIGSGAAGMYEAVLYILPKKGYEFVCLANQIAEDGIYYPHICYQSHTGEDTQNYVFSWGFSTEEGNLINIDNAAHAAENSSDGIDQSGVFALGTWSETPDTKMYAIFRKIGDEFPKFEGGHQVDGHSENIVWDLETSTGVLTISGTGKMKDYSSGKSPWYNQRTHIREVVINKGVASIGAHAFYDCNNLTSITIPEGVTSIGDGAFQYCSNLTSITLPKSVTHIGSRAFILYNLTSISVVQGNPKYDSRNNCNAIIETASNTLIVGCKATTIPEGVTSIGSKAFSFCSSLTSIDVPASVKSIEDEAFEYCVSLTSITIPESVASIGNYAFSGCSSLTSVTLPASLTSIGKQAFSSCDNLRDVTNLRSKPQSIDVFTFYLYGLLHVKPGCGKAYLNSHWNSFIIVEDAQ